jgi:hypothetical protein
MKLRKHAPMTPTLEPPRMRRQSLSNELLVIENLVMEELRHPNGASSFAMHQQLRAPNKPITALIELHDWSARLLAKLKAEGLLRERETLKNYALTLKRRSSFYLQQVTADYMLLEELTLELADFVVSSEPRGPEESGVYFTTALEITYAVLYEELSLSEALMQIDRLLNLIEPGCEPETMATARALVAELDLRLTLTE